MVENPSAFSVESLVACISGEILGFSAMSLTGVVDARASVAGFEILHSPDLSFGLNFSPEDDDGHDRFGDLEALCYWSFLLLGYYYGFYCGYDSCFGFGCRYYYCCCLDGRFAPLRCGSLGYFLETFILISRYRFMGAFSFNHEGEIEKFQTGHRCKR